MQEYQKDLNKNDQKFADTSVKYPEEINFSKNTDISYRWFYKSYNSNTSEIQAILQYTTQHSIYSNIADVLIGIGITEMHHAKKLGDLIISLGGELNSMQDYIGIGVKIGNSWQEAVKLNIEGEHAAIKEYNYILRSLQFCKESEEKKYCIDLVNKLIADEKLHIKILENLLKVKSGVR